MKETEREIRGVTYRVGEVVSWRCERLKFPRTSLVTIVGFSRKQQDVIYFNRIGTKPQCKFHGNADHISKVDDISKVRLGR